MKKNILIGIAVSIASLAQAVTITSNTSFSAPNAYIIQTAYTLDPNLNYIGASITFNNVTFTHSGGDYTLNYDLLNGSYKPGTLTPKNNSEWSDYFTTATGSNGKLLYNAYILGGKVFSYQGQTIPTWTTDFNSTALKDILSDIKNNNGYFDLGFDPNCVYTVGSITVDFTTTPKTNISVPDQASTISLLGLSLLGLLALRRKVCLN